jgi:hypothetical protein
MTGEGIAFGAAIEGMGMALAEVCISRANAGDIPSVPVISKASEFLIRFTIAAPEPISQ